MASLASVAAMLLSPNNVFLANAVFEGIFPALNLVLAGKNGPLLFPSMIPDPDPVGRLLGRPNCWLTSPSPGLPVDVAGAAGLGPLVVWHGRSLGICHIPSI